MANESPRQVRRRAKLREIVEAFDGGATGLALACGTPKSHISAILAGRRGVGDLLAEKFERAADMPPGWMDENTLTLRELAVLEALRSPDDLAAPSKYARADRAPPGTAFLERENKRGRK